MDVLIGFIALIAIWLLGYFILSPKDLLRIFGKK